MRQVVLFLLLVLAVSARAQIKLEHIYKQGGDVGLVQVDSGDWKYVQSLNDTISIYSLNHALDQQIIIPWTPTYPQGTATLLVIAKGLFSTDGKYCYLASVPIQQGGSIGLRIFKEDGATLFSCDTCYLGTTASYQQSDRTGLDGYFPPAIRTTATGAKMVVTSGADVEVYSLPGKLPGGMEKLGIIGDPALHSSNIMSATAYPNPSNGPVRIAYDLPVGVSNGEIILISEDGREVTRYHVTNAFNDLLIEPSDLPSGSYFYKLVTDKGESPARRIVLSK